MPVRPSPARGAARPAPRGPVVRRILIHLERQSAPSDFRVYGKRVVPFYNYLQAAFVLFEDGRLPAESVLRVAVELVVQHRFDGDGLARSYAELGRRGHLRGIRIDELSESIETWAKPRNIAALSELVAMVEKLPEHAPKAAEAYRNEALAEPPDAPRPDAPNAVVGRSPLAWAAALDEFHYQPLDLSALEGALAMDEGVLHADVYLAGPLGLVEGLAQALTGASYRG